MKQTFVEIKKANDLLINHFGINEIISGTYIGQKAWQIVCNYVMENHPELWKQYCLDRIFNG